MPRNMLIFKTLPAIVERIILSPINILFNPSLPKARLADYFFANCFLAHFFSLILPRID